RSWKSPQNSSAPPPAASSGPPLSLSLQAAAPSASASTGRARVERRIDVPSRSKAPWRPARTRPHETSAGAPSSTLPTAGAGPHRRAPRTGRSAVDAADLDEVGGHDLARDGPRVELLGRDVLERVLGRALAHPGEHRVERRPLLGDLLGRRDGRHPGGVGGVARLQLLVLRRLGVQGLHLGAELLAPLAGELAVDAQRVAELVAPAGGRLVLPPPPRRRRPRPPPAPRRAPRPPPRRRTTRRRRRTRRGPRRAGRRAATGDDGGSWCAPPSDGRRRLPFSGAELGAPLLDA